MIKYADAQLPAVYDSFIEEAGPLLTHERREKLRRLLDFKFERHSRYNLPKERLIMLERLVREQVKKLLSSQAV